MQENTYQLQKQRSTQSQVPWEQELFTKLQRWEISLIRPFFPDTEASL